MAMKFVLTNKGLELKAKIEAGAVLNFTKAETGDIYSPIPLELQSVPNARQILDIDSIIVNDDTATVKIILSNLENTEEYYIKQLGLYASDPDTGDEILYIIGQDNIGERVPAITDIQVEYEFNVNIKAGNAASIRFEVNGEAFLRKKQFQAFLEDEFYPHINDKEIHHKHENKKLLDTITNIFSEASTLTALKSGDTLPVLLSKTAKAISTLISHIVLTGTASVLGHVKLSDTYATKIASGAAANGLGASQNALYNAYNKLNTDLTNEIFNSVGLNGITLQFTEIGNVCIMQVHLAQAYNNANTDFTVNFSSTLVPKPLTEIRGTINGVKNSGRILFGPNKILTINTNATENSNAFGTLIYKFKN